MMTPATMTRRQTGQERALKLFVVLQRAATAVMGNLQRQADLQGLTPTEFEILEALYHKGPLLLGDVQKKILLSSGGVTYTIDRLADKGLVERRDCPTDRRARFAALTAKGEAMIAKVFPKQADNIERLMSVLSAREQEDVIAILRKLGTSAARE